MKRIVCTILMLIICLCSLSYGEDTPAIEWSERVLSPTTNLNSTQTVFYTFDPFQWRSIKMDNIAGKKLEISAPDSSDDGLVFDHWEVNSPDIIFKDKRASVTCFIVPDVGNEIEIQACYKDSKDMSLMSEESNNLYSEGLAYLYGRNGVEESFDKANYCFQQIVEQGDAGPLLQKLLYDMQDVYDINMAEIKRQQYDLDQANSALEEQSATITELENEIAELQGLLGKLQGYVSYSEAPVSVG